MCAHIVSVDLRNDQRHIGLHSEDRGIVDHDRSGRASDWNPPSRCFTPCAKKSDVDLIEGMFGESFDCDRVVTKSNRFSSGPRRGNRAQARARKTSSLEHAQKLPTDRASRAHHRNMIFFHRQADCTAALISCKAAEQRSISPFARSVSP